MLQFIAIIICCILCTYPFNFVETELGTKAAFHNLLQRKAATPSSSGVDVVTHQHGIQPRRLPWRCLHLSSLPQTLFTGSCGAVTSGTWLV